MSGSSSGRRVCLGAIAGPHGVRGAFKIKTFTEDETAIASYGPLETEDRQRQLTIKLVRVLKPGLVLATAPGLDNPEMVKALSSVRLYVDRARLPALEEDEAFYIDDLVGLAVETPDGAGMGRIRAVHDFGAGDLLEVDRIPGRKQPALIAFTRALVPGVDLAAGRVVIVADAFREQAGEPETGEPAAPEDLAALDDRRQAQRDERPEDGDAAAADLIDDQSGEIVSTDPAVNRDAMRAEDA